MANTAELTIVLKADGSGLTGTVRVAADELRKLGVNLDDVASKGKKAGDSAAASARDIGLAVKAYDVLFDSVGKVAGAFVNLAKTQIDYADTTGKLAAKVGFSTEALSALEHAARSNNESLTAIPSALDALATSAARAAAGARVQAADYKALGISLRDTATGAMKPMEQLLSEVATKLAGYRDGAAKTALANRLLGSGASELMLTLKDLGEQGFDGLMQKADAAGRLISGQTAADAAKFNDALQGIKDRIAASALSIGTQLLPVLTDAAEGMAHFMDEAAKSESIKQLFDELWATIRTGISLFHELANAIGLTAQDDFLPTFLRNTRREMEAIEALIPKIQSFVAFIGKPAERAARIEAKRQAPASAQNPFDGMDTATLVAASKPLLTDLTGIWNKLTSSVDTYGLHAKQVGADANKPDAPLPAIARHAGEAEKASERVAQMFARDAQELARLQGALDPVNKVYQQLAATIGNAQKQYENEVAEINKSHLGTEALAQAKQNLIDKTNAAIAAEEAEIAAMVRKNDVVGNYLQKIAEETATLGMTKRHAAITEALNREVAAWNKLSDAEKKQQTAAGHIDPTSTAGSDAVKAAAAGLFDAKKQASELEEILGRFGQRDEFASLTASAKRLGDEIKKALDIGPPTAEMQQHIDELQQSLGRVKAELVQGIAGGAAQALRGMQSMADQGSDAYKAMEVAINALALVQGISAILNQGTGDPYSAPVRMAAMAAAIAPLIANLAGSIGAFGGSGGFSDTAKQRQALQGTGSVLGDAQAKSESIARATDITANATQTLVGLNRGMLTALQALQNGIGGASTMLARGAGAADFSGMNLSVEGSSGFWNLASKGDPLFLLGGSTKITDEGIIIFGGALSDLLQNVAVGAYQEVQSKTWAFGSTHTKEGIKDISDQFGKQFALVISSIADTVREGALALGLLPADIEAAMAAFKVEEMRISLKGLSAEDQQKELQAVFSQLFDGLAGSVVPFIAQFQRVGEGLGETLVRVATEVQVAQQAFAQLGLVVDATNPEKFAQISDALISATGGIEAFVSGLQSFVSNFASDSQKMDVAAASLSSAFTQVGLTVPETRAGMWDLMQTLDATTEEGQKQIVTLLRLADVSDQFYSLLEKSAAKLNEQLQALWVGTDPGRAYAVSLINIRNNMNDMIAAANAAARAAGLQGAKESDLARIHSLAAAQAAAAMDALRNAGRSIVDRLYGGGTLDGINAEIERLQGGASGASSAVGGFGDAMSAAADKAKAAIDLLLGALSPLNDQQKLATALDAQMRGLATPDQVLEIGRRLYASSQAYTDLYKRVTAIGDRTGNSVGGGGSGGDASQSASDPARLAQLIKLRDDMMAEQRRQDARDLASTVATMAFVQEESYQKVADELHFNLADLAKDLGMNADELNAYLDNLKKQTNAVPDSITSNTNRLIDAWYDINGKENPYKQDNQAAHNDNGPPQPTGHDTRDLPRGPTGDETDVPSTPTGHDMRNLPINAPPPPSGSSVRGGTVEAAVIDDVSVGLRDVRAALAELLAATRAGSGNVVEAVRETTRSVNSVDTALQRGADQAGLNDRRNTRDYAP